MNSSTKTDFELFLKSLPYLSGLLIFLGIAKVYVFYKVFGIDVLQYLTLSEAIIISVDYFVIMSFTMLICGFVGYTQGRKKSVTDFKPFTAEFLEEKSFLKRKLFMYKRYWKVHFTFTFFIIAIFVACLILKLLVMAYLAITLYLLLELYITFIFENLRYSIIRTPLVNSNIVTALFFFLVMTIGILYFSLFQASKIKNCKHELLTKITFKDKNIYITSDTVIYIGHLEKYTFLYNKKINAPKIISNEEIHEIEWIGNPFYKP